MPANNRRSSYDQPDDFANLNEEAVDPPVARADRRSYRRQSTLETNNNPTRRRRAGQDGAEEGLTEVAAPAPIQNASDRDSSSASLDQHQYPEDTEGLEDDDVDSAEPPPFGTRSPRTVPPKAPQVQVPRGLTEIYTISYLIFFSFLGTLARLGVQWLAFYPGAPDTTPVIWANFGGSLFMGFLAEDQALFRESSQLLMADHDANDEKQSHGTNEERAAAHKAAAFKHKKTIPLYIGLATGFCGSFTSFSSFARDFFLALANSLPSPIDHPYPAGIALSTSTTVHRNGGYSFLALIGVILQTLSLSIGGLITGAQIAILLQSYTPGLPHKLIMHILDRVMIFLAFGCWLGAIFLAIWPPDRPGGPDSRGSWSREVWRGEVLFALVFAPLGCLLRFYASLKLNGLVAAFPLGTFSVNMLGTAVEGMCYDIQHVRVGVMGRVGGGRVGCQVLQGVMDGFCGCLTTVSTWVAEINGLKRKHGWLYAFSTLIGGLCLMVVIMGSVRWSVGYSSPVCNTGYTDKIHG